MKRYQIERQRAIRNLEQQAVQKNPPVPMIIPLAEVVGQLQNGMKQLMGTLLQMALHETMQQEMKFLVGERSHPDEQRNAYRWGSEQGYCVIQGQKLHLGRPRVVDKRTHRELPLGS